MFAVKRIFRNKKHLTSYISTTGVLKCDKPEKIKETNDLGAEISKKKQKKNTKGNRNKFFAFDNSVNPKQEKTQVSEKTKIVANNKKEKSPPFDFFKKSVVLRVRDVANELGGDKEKTADDLLTYLQKFEVTKDLNPESKDLLQDAEQDQMFPSSALRRRLESSPIFDSNFAEAHEVKLKLWDELEAEELAQLSKCAPRNHFEEMIEWTNAGRLWHFPIDNDQGLEEEAKTSFTEHIFLEQHLEPWCPSRGPLRKFMEIVLVGLSKNPNYTVEQKKAHIDWFRRYFDEKKKLLQELGAFAPPKEIENSDVKENSNN